MNNLNLQSQLLLRLNLELDLKHEVTDTLLTFEPFELSFISYQVQSHQANQVLHSIREQVDGYTPKIIVEVSVPSDALTQVLAHLKAALPSAQIPYQILPEVLEGQL